MSICAAKVPELARSRARAVRRSPCRRGRRGSRRRARASLSFASWIAKRFSTGSGTCAVAVLESRPGARAARPRSRSARAAGGGRSSAPRTRCSSAGTYASTRASTRTGRAAIAPLAGELGDGLARAARRRARSRARRRGPDCSSPSRLPAPRISRSRIAIAKPEPSSVWSASVARRARASGGQLRRVGIEEVRVRGHVGAADAAADLVELRRARAGRRARRSACSPAGCRGPTR